MGQYDEALPHLTRARALGKEIGDAQCVVPASAYLARAHVAQGNVAAAREVLAGLEARAQDGPELVEVLRQAYEGAGMDWEGR
jgi:hypothetical protein